MAQVRALLEKYGESRFAELGSLTEDRADDRPLNERWGFRRANSAGETSYLVLPEAWRTALCAGFDAGAIARAMLKRAWIVPNQSDLANPTSQHRLPGMGKSKRCYHVAASFLGGEGEDDA